MIIKYGLSIFLSELPFKSMLLSEVVEKYLPISVYNQYFYKLFRRKAKQSEEPAFSITQMTQKTNLTVPNTRSQKNQEMT